MEKISGKHVLKNERGRIIFKATKLDDISSHLGLGDSALKYQQEVQKFWIEMAAEDGKNAFIKWAFPDGLEKVTVKQAQKIAKRHIAKTRGSKPGGESV